MSREKLKKMLFAIVSLNVFDAVATLKWLELGFAKEANPLMAPLIAYCPSCFMFVKIGIASLVCLYLWRVKENKYNTLATKIVFAAYTALAMWHMVGFYKMFELFS
jgi:hypothetical protein